MQIQPPTRPESLLLLSPSELISALLYRWPRILLVVAIFTFVALLVALTRPHEYLVVQRALARNDLGGIKEVTITAFGGPGQSSREWVVLSRDLVQRAISEEGANLILDPAMLTTPWGRAVAFVGRKLGLPTPSYGGVYFRDVRVLDPSLDRARVRARVGEKGVTLWISGLGEEIELAPGESFKSQRLELTLERVSPNARGQFRGQLTLTRRAYEKLHKQFYYQEYGTDRQLFDIGFYHRDPYLARRLVEALYRGYVELRRQGFEEETRARLKFIDRELENVRQELFKRLEELVSLERESQPEVLTPEGEEVFNRLVSLRTRREEIKLRMAGLRELLSSFRVEDVGNYLLFMGEKRDAMQKLAEQYLSLSAQKERLMVDLTEKHPQVVAIQRQMDELAERIRKNVENELASLADNLKETEGLIEQYQKRAEKIPQLKSEITQLTQRIDVLKGVYELLINKRTEAELELKGFAPTFQVISPAQVPVLPARPRLRSAVLVGLLVGLVFQLLVELLLIVVIGVVVSPAQVGAILQVPVLRLTSRRRRAVAERLRRILGEAERVVLFVHPQARLPTPEELLAGSSAELVAGTPLDAPDRVGGKAVVLVIPWGKMTLEELSELGELIQQLGGSLAALVLADPKRRWW